MDSIFAKLILLFASILGVFSGANYIQIGTDSLTFDFKTGENHPIYYLLNVQNIGPEKERFEISSNQSWVSVYREGTDYTFVELPSQAYVNFVLTIRPERLPDGISEAKVFIKVLDIDSLVSQEMVLDETEVSIVLNKNIIPTLMPTEISSPTESIPAPTPSLVSSPAVEPSQTQTTPVDLNPVLKQIQSLINSIRILLKNFF